MDWAEDFYTRTGAWWAEAESDVGDRDRGRVERLHRLCGDAPKRILELGCSYGNTAAALAEAGHRVVGVELSGRADRAFEHAARLGGDRLRVVRGDFYEADLDERFDAVVYWNGFGIGEDADQRRLLRRIASEWLAPGGTALVDVFNPLVWAGWDGDLDLLEARPEHGYRHELHQRVVFDPVSSIAQDTWWDTADPDLRITQRIRCYSPADLRLLLEGTGLRLGGLLVGDAAVDPGADHGGFAALLREHHEYLAVLKPDGSAAAS